MNAKKCDRCERFYEPYQPDAALKYSNMLIFMEEYEDKYGSSYYKHHHRFELYPDCMADAVKFTQAMMGGE